MKYKMPILAASAGFLSTISAHGLLTSPKPRLAGTAMEAACGQQVYNNQASDSYGNIQGELQVAATQTDYHAAECQVWLCKGYKFSDNSANIQSWTPGQVVDFTFDVRAPHTGYANVSIVSTATNTIIGDMLLVYEDFADNSKTIPANETAFSLTIPELGSQCQTPGACVVQHFWSAGSIDQTYESCVDFTVGGSGSGSSSSSAASSSAAASVPATARVASTPAVVSSGGATSAPVIATGAPLSASSAVSLSSAVSISAAPTTLYTMTRASTYTIASTSTETAAGASSTADPEDDDDEC